MAVPGVIEAVPSSANVPTAQNPLPVLGTPGDYTSAKKIDVEYALAQAQRQMLSQLSAKSAIVIDAASDNALFARNPDAPRQPASTIKVLTGMIALKSLNTNDAVAISRKAAGQPSSKIYLDQRRHYPAGDLVKAVLLASANDASVALAEKIAGSEQLFAKMMTLRAKLWGAKSTICKTASGLTAKGQRSTSRDLAVIFKNAMADNEFAAIMQRSKDHTSEGKLLRNHNRALWRIEGSLGGKTGYTNAARQTYVGKFKRGQSEIIVAIMGSEHMWKDLANLVEYGFLKHHAITVRQQKMEDIQIAGLN
jgi:D-alanyl-D-alanine carboxypeptidase (penicillin-binding protein 5/6)